MSSRSQSGRQSRSAAKAAQAIHWAIAVVAILALTAWLMRGWLAPYLAPAPPSGRALPTSSRREVLTEMAIVWMFQQELTQGQMLSEWNPYWFSGFPWLRFLSYPLYYVVAGLTMLLKFSLDQSLVAFFFIVMAGSGLAMYLYLRKILSPSGQASPAAQAAALVGAMIYEALPYHSHVGVETWIHAAFWVVLPLALWAIELAGRSGAAPPTPVADTLGAMGETVENDRAPSLLGMVMGHMPRLLLVAFLLALFPVISSEYALFAGPLVGLYLFVHELTLADLQGDADEGALARAWLRLRLALLSCLAVAAVAIGLSAFFLLPGLLETQYVGIHAKHAQGTTFSDELLRNYSVTPRLVWYAIGQRLHLPARLRLPVTDPSLPSIVRSFWSVSWYPGLFVTALGLIGLTAVRRHRAAALALGGLLLSLMIASGPTFALNFYTHLPVLGRLSPFRSLLLAGLFGSTLAAYGVRWLVLHVHAMLARWAPSGGPYSGHASRLVRRIAQAARASLPWGVAVPLIVLIALDYGPAAGAYQTTDAYFSPSEKDAYAWLAEQEHSGRAWEAAELPRDQYLRSASVLEFSTPRYIGYYDNGAPLHTWQQAAWSDLGTALYLHQVRYVLLRADDASSPRLRPALGEAGFAVAHEVEGIQIWENPDHAPFGRFYGITALDVGDSLSLSFKALPTLVSRGVALVATDMAGDARTTQKRLTALDPDDPSAWPFDYLLIDKPVIRDGAAEIILPQAHQDRYLTAETLAQLPAAPVMDAWIWPERIAWDQIQVEVEVPVRGVLTVAESWYPHWRAEVDGEPRPVLRTNWALMGVHLQPGLHRVRFYFQRPWYVFVGFGISLLTLSAIALLATRYLTQKLYRPRIMANEVHWKPANPMDVED